MKIPPILSPKYYELTRAVLEVLKEYPEDWHSVKDIVGDSRLFSYSRSKILIVLNQLWKAQIIHKEKSIRTITIKVRMLYMLRDDADLSWVGMLDKEKGSSTSKTSSAYQVWLEQEVATTQARLDTLEQALNEYKRESQTN